NSHPIGPRRRRNSRGKRELSVGWDHVRVIGSRWPRGYIKVASIQVPGNVIQFAIQLAQLLVLQNRNGLRNQLTEDVAEESGIERAPIPAADDCSGRYLVGKANTRSNKREVV